MISAVGVVIPARNEARLLPACLDAVQEAIRELDRRNTSVALAIVLDSCTDASRAVAERSLATGAAVDIVEIDAANVGVARAAGLAAALDRLGGHPPDAIWIATTDADSRVPPDWLARQVDLADDGADVVAGTIEIRDWEAWPEQVRHRFLEHYVIRADGTHDHVHGANLGFRASACLAVGGIPDLPLAEDQALLDAIVRTGARVARTSSIPVATSARAHARADAGFGAFLGTIAERAPGA